MLLPGLFYVTSIDFSIPLPTSAGGNEYSLIAMGHLTGWPIAPETKDTTTSTVIYIIIYYVLISLDRQKFHF